MFWIVLIFVSIVAYFTVFLSSKPQGYKRGSSVLYDQAIAAAVNLYKKRVAEGMVVTDGPCLTNDLMLGWVVDLVHSPRSKIDDLPQNQCQAYLEGRAIHFVELDLNGNFVRVK